ncbi:MAG: MotA/TolQ/ExbB proton channel family protein [Anaplasma sp.]
MQGVVVSSVDVQSGLLLFSAFANADIVVKTAMVTLIAFSVVSWAVIFKKQMVLGRRAREIKDLEERFSPRRTFTNLSEMAENSTGVVAQILSYGLRNSALVSDKRSGLHRFMAAELNRVLDQLEDNIEILATIASSSPFIGLLGTVWGIVHSLQSIPIGVGVSIASIAPGMAEALFSTALGLIAAIPANIFYNKFTASIAKMSNRLSNLVYELEAFAADDG